MHAVAISYYKRFEGRSSLLVSTWQNYTACMTMSVELTEEDVPGAALKEPLESHTVHALKWWLLCRGEKAPTSCKKAQYVSRHGDKDYNVVYDLPDS